MAACHLSLYVPGLLAAQPALAKLPAAERPDLNVLEKFLSRAVRRPNPLVEATAGLFQLFNLPADEQGEYPAAAVTQQVFELEIEGYCLHADPVYIQADLTSAVALAHEQLALSDAEAAALVTTLNAHLAEEGMQLVQGAAHHWYLISNEPVTVQTTALPEVLGQDIDPLLPRGTERRRWHRLINELQMLLHQHPVNLQREAQGQLPVTSVWLWGAGRSPQAPAAACHWQQVYSDELIAQGLGLLHGVEVQGVPDSAGDILEQCRDNILLVQMDVYPTVLQRDVFAWLDELEYIQNTWLAPLLKALDKRQVESITLIPANGQQYMLDRKAWHRWWRRRRPLSHWLAS